MTNRSIPRRLNRRALLILVAHCVAFVTAYVLSFSLRYEFNWMRPEYQYFWGTLPTLLVIKLSLFYILGHCHRSWRDATFSDLAALLRATTLASLVFATFIVLSGYDMYPRPILVLDWAMTVLVLGGMRAVWRMTHEEFRPLIARSDSHRALIIGANRCGESLARQFRGDVRLNYLAVGFLDDDENRHGSTLGGFPVLGSPDDAVSIADEHAVDDILMISGVLMGSRLRKLMEECEQAGIRLKIIPGTDDLLTSEYPLQIRDVNIDDLLRREPVQLSSDAIRSLVTGRTIMVTGAGGSIGSEICRQVLRFEPASLVLVERAENNLFLIEKEFRDRNVDAELHACLADITDAERMEYLFAHHRPAIVFHAAAHKHVPMMEINPGEAIKNNVLGTKLVAELADAYGAEEFVMISTDKAVNPTSMMGASKQIAERFIHAFSESATTKFVVVRFGNVLASAGSVVPIFQEQIRHGGPLTVTHPEIKRYFMTIPEASQLVLQAAAMGKGGEIFVLDMGEPVLILDLARDLIRLSGLDPEDIDIIYTGLRPGEKLFEELYFDEEQMLATPHPKLFVAYHRPCNLDGVCRDIVLLAAAAGQSSEKLREAVKKCVPEYTPFDPAPVEPNAEPTIAGTAVTDSGELDVESTLALATPNDPQKSGGSRRGRGN
ncbi:MAG: nucleoside-diphosphate sugar epimerase/dehydratase [Pirellulales bacterium]